VRACVREGPFKCINNEKPVTGMSSDIGSVVMYPRVCTGWYVTSFDIFFNISEILDTKEEGGRGQAESHLLAHSEWPFQGHPPPPPPPPSMALLLEVCVDCGMRRRFFSFPQPRPFR